MTMNRQGLPDSGRMAVTAPGPAASGPADLALADLALADLARAALHADRSKSDRCDAGEAPVVGLWPSLLTFLASVFGTVAQAKRTAQSKRTVLALTVGVVSLSAAALVIAQEPAPKATDEAGLERKLDQSRAYVDRMRNMISAGFAELDEARRSQNVSRVNCVSDALNTMKGLLRLAESIYLSMQECTSRKDASCAEHEYVKISVAFNKCEDMEGQLKGCGGPSVDGAIDGRPVIEKAVDPDIPDLNPTSGLADLAPKLEVPPSASPFFKSEGG